MEALFFAMLLMLVLYVAAVVTSGKYESRWRCAGFLVVLAGLGMGWIYFVTGIGVFGAPGKVLLRTSPVWGYLIILAVAALAARRRTAQMLIFAAHGLVLLGAFGWGMGREVVALLGLLLLGWPIWMGILGAKPASALSSGSSTAET